MSIDEVNEIYNIIDHIPQKAVVDDQTTNHKRTIIKRLSTLEHELENANRNLARAFSQREYNQIQETIDTLEGKISKLQQELSHSTPEWMIRVLRSKK